MPAAGDIWEHDGLYYEVQPAASPGDVALAEQGLVAISHRPSMPSKIHSMSWLAEHGALISEDGEAGKS